jgi:energy-coupling factor transporter ATP-binding protein EcfA2
MNPPPINFPRGSEWRRWDLHVHTPFSALNNGFGDDFDAYAKGLLTRAVSAGIAVIGVTDYFVIEGYKQLLALVRDKQRLDDLLGEQVAEAASQIVLLPNVELRIGEIIRGPGGQDSRFNFHVLFSEELTTDEIEEHFLRELKFTYEAEPDEPDQRRSLTTTNLEELGSRLKSEHDAFKGSDLYTGMLTAVVAHNDVSEVLERQKARFKDRVLIVVPADEDLSELSWDGQGHLVRKVLIQKAHMLFSANPGTREFGLGRRHDAADDFVREFKSLKPCIHGSDAHSFDKLFAPDKQRYLWIKADPTFQGLRQLLHEPADRVFLGEEPPSLGRVARNATRYFSAVEFDRSALAPSTSKWFSGSVPLNDGLIAIIGNKGSGKSALADILGLLGDARSYPYFSFLSEDRFLAPKTDYGRSYTSTLTWNSGERSERALGDPVDTTSPERTKYIPQNYLETICTELRDSSDTEFDRELEEVIFSHVATAERLGMRTLPELLVYCTSEKEAKIEQLLSRLSEVNQDIVTLESQLTDTYRKKLEGELDQREKELKAHDEARPAVVQDPGEDATAQEASTGAKATLEQLVQAIEDADERLKTAGQRLDEVNRYLAAITRLDDRIRNLESVIERFYEESGEEVELLAVDKKKLVSLRVDRKPLVEAREKYTAERLDINAMLDWDDENSLVRTRESLSKKADETRELLDEPNRRHQEYLHQLALWTQRRSEIHGSDEAADSVLGLRARVAALSRVPDQIRDQEVARVRLLRQIYEVKSALLDDYRRLYSPVQEFIDTHPVSQQMNALQFTASMADDGFIAGFLHFIHHGKRGSFQGEQEARERLRNVIARTDFATADGVERFVGEVQQALKTDMRDDTRRAVQVRDQLRQGIKPQALYDYLYGLSYLRPRFELLWREKSLDQLSPGERGTLLLVFYLLVDRREIPLIIDQPEGNLDNPTITALMVPAIKYAKERRQIVIVTHNPNIGVVCDADQVIHATLDKTDGNKVTYVSGSIENQRITELIVDVLEGTKPAFDLRDSRYDVLERPGTT